MAGGRCDPAALAITVQNYNRDLDTANHPTPSQHKDLCRISSWRRRAYANETLPPPSVQVS